MLKDICLTPQIFAEAQLAQNARWKDVKTLLNSIRISGYIVGLNNKEWVKAIRQEIDNIGDQKIKTLFISLVDNLKDCNRIVGHPKGDIEPNIENEWVHIAEDLDAKEKFYAMFATKPINDKITTLEDLEDENITDKYGNVGSISKIKSEEELKEIFRPLLSYARKLTIIDPYFNITEKRYANTLEFMLEYYRNKRGIKDKGSIVIHCSNKIYINDRWIDKIKTIYQTYGHTIKIMCWDRKDDASLKLHERYIVTDQAAVVSGAGVDKDDYQQSEWSIKKYEEIGSLLKQYNENSSDYKLVAEITASGIKKYN